MGKPDLTSPRVLQALARDRLTIAQIAARTGLPDATVRGALGRLQARGEVRHEWDVGLKWRHGHGRERLWARAKEVR